MADGYSTWAVRSFIIGLVAALLTLVGWLGTAKDQSVLKAIADLSAKVDQIGAEGKASDLRISDSITKLCDRVGGVESRVGNLEIFIQMPFDQRLKLIRPPDFTGKKNGKE